MVKVNGESVNCGGQTAEQFLLEHGYDLKRVAVECNGEIVPKSQYSSYVFKDGDSVEVVRFVGGG
ncbi:MAG: sulfur carrier protein ThiS [Clostridia bacterium]|nr:sulfur carrier protein ThiS [Clostridia bacterium]